MEKIQLTQRNYLGNWNYVGFKNENEEYIYQEITEEDYSNLDKIPVPEGYKMVVAGLGGLKADTLTGALDNGEYMQVGESFYVRTNNVERMMTADEFNSQYI